MNVFALLPAVVFVALQDPEFRPPLAEWNARDLEGRWVLLEAETLAHGWRNVEPMIGFLETRREVELLERLCLYPRAEGQFAAFEAALARLDAPQWARAVEWNLRQHDSHKRDEATAAFVERRPALALDWLERHEESLEQRARDVLARLRTDGAARSPSSHLLPPWNLKEVLEPLKSTQPVIDFGTRQRAVPGELYLHTIENLLRVIAQRQLYGEPWRDAVIALTRHTRPEVRAFAWIALGEAARSSLPISALADEAVLTVIDDSNEDVRARIAATVALGQRAAWSPHAWCELHRIAEALEHPVWAAAVDSLREVGDEMSIELLEELVPALTDDTRMRLAKNVIEALRERGAIANGSLPSALERTAFAEVSAASIDARRKSWTRRFFASAKDNPELRSALLAIASGYEAALDVRESVERKADPMRFNARMHAWATELIGERR